MQLPSTFLVKYYILLLGLPEEFKGKRKDKKDSVPYKEKEKLVLDGQYKNFLTRRDPRIR